MLRALVIGAALACGAAQAQPVTADGVAPAASVSVVDFERFFDQSLFGARVSQDYAAARDALIAEQRQIAMALREEELALAVERATMDPAVFRAEADAFDEKARSIRRAQDAKVDALEATLAEARTQFLEISRPVLQQLMNENGSGVLLDHRSAVLWHPSADITEAAIARIDAVIGAGPQSDEDQP